MLSSIEIQSYIKITLYLIVLMHASYLPFFQVWPRQRPHNLPYTYFGQSQDDILELGHAHAYPVRSFVRLKRLRSSLSTLAWVKDQFNLFLGSFWSYSVTFGPIFVIFFYLIVLLLFLSFVNYAGQYKIINNINNFW